jgi:hypothetical protein
MKEKFILFSVPSLILVNLLLFFLLGNIIFSENKKPGFHLTEFAKINYINRELQDEKKLLQQFQDKSIKMYENKMFDRLTEIPRFRTENIDKLLNIDKKVSRLQKKVLDLTFNIADKHVKINEEHLNEITNIKVSVPTEMTDTVIEIPLFSKLSHLIEKNNELIILHNNKPIYYWIDSFNSQNPILWIRIDEVSPKKPVILTLSENEMKYYNFNNSLWNQGSKVFSLFVDRHTFYGWDTYGAINPSLNIRLIPGSEGLRVDTSYHRKDLGISRDIHPMENNIEIKYVIKNFNLPTTSYQFQLNTYTDVGGPVTTIDSPIYARKKAAFRKQNDTYREISLGSIEYGKKYCIKHIVNFEKQTVDYSIFSETGKIQAELKDQSFQVGGRCSSDKIPIVKCISRVSLGHNCSGEIGDTELSYLFIKTIPLSTPIVQFM